MKILPRLFDKRSEGEGFANDRRIVKRYDVPLKLTYFDPATKCKGEALTRNICRTGLRFPVSTKIPKGSIVELAIEGPYGDALISSKAKVIWMEKFITGDNAEDVIYEGGVKLLKNRLF